MALEIKFILLLNLAEVLILYLFKGNKYCVKYEFKKA